MYMFDSYELIMFYLHLPSCKWPEADSGFASSLNMPSLTLGVDIGTSSVKVVLVNGLTKEVVETYSQSTSASLETPSLYSEQDPRKIFETFTKCLQRLQETNLRQVTSIGICGQMHGMLMWNMVEGAFSNLLHFYSLVVWRK